MNTSKTIAFPENKDLPSFVTFPIPNGLEHSTKLWLKFLAKDISQDGLLMFLGDVTMDTDYFIIDIVNQTIRLRYNLGGGEFALSSERLNNIYDIYDLLVQRHGANATMQVNNMTHVKKTTTSKFEDLNFNSNSELRLGWVNGQPQFVGCILSLEINDPENMKKCWRKKQSQFSKLSKRVEVLGTKALSGRGVTGCPPHDLCPLDPCGSEGHCDITATFFQCRCSQNFSGKFCSEKKSSCLSSPCLHNASCADVEGSFLCSCPIGWSGNKCEKQITISDPSFNGTMTSWMIFDPVTLRRRTEVKVQIKPMSQTGLIFYVHNDNDGNNCDFLSIYLQENYIFLQFSLGYNDITILKHPLFVHNHQWHKISAGRIRNLGHLKVSNLDHYYDDNDITIKSTDQSGMFALDVTSSIYLGGYPNMGMMVGNLPSVGFTGCVRKFEVNDLKFDLDYYWGERSPEVNSYDVTIHTASNVITAIASHHGKDHDAVSIVNARLLVVMTMAYVLPCLGLTTMSVFVIGDGRGIIVMS
ncbi:protein eyes shut homolog [Ciona intestinalis]